MSEMRHAASMAFVFLGLSILPTVATAQAGGTSGQTETLPSLPATVQNDTIASSTEDSIDIASQLPSDAIDNDSEADPDTASVRSTKLQSRPVSENQAYNRLRESDGRVGVRLGDDIGHRLSNK